LNGKFESQVINGVRRIKCDNSDVFMHHYEAAAHQTWFSPTRFAKMKSKEAALTVQLEYYRALVVG
jgi:hypothetical protein